MKFLELNKKRHATKHFTDKPVDPKDVRTAIEIATLAPSAHNSQPWKFVVVREKMLNWQSWHMVRTLNRCHQRL